MAESQVPYAYTQQGLDSLREVMSVPRFNRYYLAAGRDNQYAAQLYLYNARIAKAFLYPLNVVEVTLRNAIDSILVPLYGADWHTDARFTRTVLTEKGESTLLKAIDRAGVGANHNQVVATLTFDFWSNMFKASYHTFWGPHLQNLFPQMPHGTTPADVQLIVRDVTDFRNRVAHHEPVLDANINAIHAKIVSLVSWRCPETAKWLRHHSTVHSVTRNKPKKADAAGPTVASRADPQFVSCNSSETLFAVLAKLTPQTHAIVCVDQNQLPVSAHTPANLALCSATLAAELEGTVDLNGHTIGDLVQSGRLTSSWVAFSASENLAVAIEAFTVATVQVVVATDDATGAANGVIVRSHRRY